MALEEWKQIQQYTNVNKLEVYLATCIHTTHADTQHVVYGILKYLVLHMW